MDNSTCNNGKNKKGANKNKNNKKGSIKNSLQSSVEKILTVSAPVETPETKFRNILVETVINLCLNHKMTIFGSYVREYMCRRPFDAETSDIDVFFTEGSISSIVRHLRCKSIQTEIDTSKSLLDYSDNEDKKFTVYHMKLSFINDELFLGKKVYVHVDFVKGDTGDYPPFSTLDFTCNAWIWDLQGIRLSCKTGTDIDNLSARDVKDREMEILHASKARITEYNPIDKGSDLRTMDNLTMYRRRTRVDRIVKLLRKDWKIVNLPNLEQIHAQPGEICNICQDEVVDMCLKMKCCMSRYHHACFTEYAKAELEEHTYVRCTQRCSELYL